MGAFGPAQPGLAFAVLMEPGLSELMLKPCVGDVRRELVLPLLAGRAGAVLPAVVPLPL
jgi:hypothetical protein